MRKTFKTALLSLSLLFAFFLVTAETASAQYGGGRYIREYRYDRNAARRYERYQRWRAMQYRRSYYRYNYYRPAPVYYAPRPVYYRPVRRYYYTPYRRNVSLLTIRAGSRW